MYVRVNVGLFLPTQSKCFVNGNNQWNINRFESEDGISRQEDGEVKEALDEENKPHSVVVVRGSYSYPGEGGKPETINYYADETGFHAEGDSIPKPASR